MTSLVYLVKFYAIEFVNVSTITIKSDLCGIREFQMRRFGACRFILEDCDCYQSRGDGEYPVGN